MKKQAASFSYSLYFLLSSVVIGISWYGCRDNGITATLPIDEDKAAMLDSFFLFIGTDSLKNASIHNKLSVLLQEDYSEYIDIAHRSIVLIDTHRRNLHTTKSEIARKQLDSIASKYRQYPLIQARIYDYLAYQFMNRNLNHEAVLDYHNKINQAINDHPNIRFPRQGEYYAKMAAIYFKYREYNRVIELMNKIVALGDDPYRNRASNLWTAYNNIGLCYQELGLLDTAIVYFTKASAIKNVKDPELNYGIALGNIGQVYYQKKQYREAIPLIVNDFNTGIKYVDLGLSAGAAIPLASIYSRQHNRTEAKRYLDAARSFIDSSAQYNRLEKYYAVAMEYYDTLGDKDKVIIYGDSLRMAIKRNYKDFSEQLLLRVENKKNNNIRLQEKMEFQKSLDYQKQNNTIIYSLLLGGIVVSIIVYYYRNKSAKIRRQLDEYEKMNAIRTKISADMHDEVGSSLSSIGLYAHLLSNNPEPQQAQKILKKISENTQKVQENISDIIWSINPNHDKIESLVSKIRAFGIEICEPKDILFTLNENIAQQHVVLNMLQKKNLYLIFKEAVNNAVKYSQCTAITVSIDYDNRNLLHMSIIDNGKGFSIDQAGLGNGIMNLRLRAKELNGTMNINSSPEGGSSVVLQFPV